MLGMRVRAQVPPVGEAGFVQRWAVRAGGQWETHRDSPSRAMKDSLGKPLMRGGRGRGPILPWLGHKGEGSRKSGEGGRDLSTGSRWAMILAGTQGGWLSQGARRLVIEAETGSLGRSGGRHVAVWGPQGTGAAAGTRALRFATSTDPVDRPQFPLRAEMASGSPSASYRILFCSIFSLKHWKSKKHIFAYWWTPILLETHHFRGSLPRNAFTENYRASSGLPPWKPVGKSSYTCPRLTWKVLSWWTCCHITRICAPSRHRWLKTRGYGFEKVPHSRQNELGNLQGLEQSLIPGTALRALGPVWLCGSRVH